MRKVIGIGHQNFEKVRQENIFYIDKTRLIKEWWEKKDDVTMIIRPRRFGKTLNMSMLECFFSVNYPKRSDLFTGLSIWREGEYRFLQGTYPVLSLSFANVKENSCENTKYRIYQLLEEQYDKHRYLLEGGILTEREKVYFKSVSTEMTEVTATIALYRLCCFLSRYYGKKVIILLDEYDTPMQEAYVCGYWEELVPFLRSLFHSTFKINPYLERAMMTGMTRIGKEFVFSDLNNLKVVTVTSDEYSDSFGFTEQEVFTALEEYGLSDKKGEIKYWYDGFVFGNTHDIYNPWSIINYLNTKKFAPYWANTRSNSLIGRLIQEGSRGIKEKFEDLLSGKTLRTRIDEQIIYEQLQQNEKAIWSFLLECGYLKAKYHSVQINAYGECEENYELEITNFEIRVIFRLMIQNWFASCEADYHDFIKALLAGNLDEMNAFINEITIAVFHFFGRGTVLSKKEEAEKFYHGLVLGLVVDLNGRYMITSNRESGFGRYDVMLEPFDHSEDAIIIEFKVCQEEAGESLEEAVADAHAQIDAQGYVEALQGKGIPCERIQRYGGAFLGGKVLIG